MDGAIELRAETNEADNGPYSHFVFSHPEEMTWLTQTLDQANSCGESQDCLLTVLPGDPGGPAGPGSPLLPFWETKILLK